MKINDIVSSALSLAEKHAPQLVAELTQLQANAAQSSFKVVVLGEFKAGKSTLINSLFLKERLLPVDYQEATAVPTHLCNGAPCMQTWLRREDGTETLVNETHDIDEVKIAAAVTASSEEERAKKAESYSRVLISKPDILPPGIILVDTPGLNSVNTRIIVGTMAEAHSADAVLYVVRGRQLSQKEQQRIAEIAGKQQSKLPVQVILTVDDTMASGQVQMLRESIAAQLRMYDISCQVSVFDMSAQTNSAGSLSSSLDTGFGDWNDDWGFSSPSESKEQASSGAIEEELQLFFNGEVRRGRDARLCRDLLPVLQRLNMAIESRLALSGQNEESINKLSMQMEDKRSEYLRVIKHLLMDVKVAQNRFADGIEKHLDEVRNTYIKLMNVQEEYDGLANTFKDCVENLPVRIQRSFEVAQSDMQRDMNDISAKYKIEFENALQFEGSSSVDLGQFINVVSKIPSWAVTAADIVIFHIITPYGWITDFALRYIGGKIPLLNKLMPKNIAISIAKNVAVSKLTEVMSETKKDIRLKLEESFIQMQHSIENELTESGDIFSDLQLAINEAREGVLSAQQVAELKEASAQVKQWGANL